MLPTRIRENSDKQALIQEVYRKGNFPIDKRSQWDGSKHVRLRMSFSDASDKAWMSKFAQTFLNQGLIQQSVGPRQFKILCTPPLKFLFLSCVYVNVVVTLFINFLTLRAKYIPTLLISTCEHQLLKIMLCKLVHCNQEYDANKLLHVVLNN